MEVVPENWAELGKGERALERNIRGPIPASPKRVEEGLLPLRKGGGRATASPKSVEDRADPSLVLERVEVGRLLSSSPDRVELERIPRTVIS